jgi:hypothetical protein
MPEARVSPNNRGHPSDGPSRKRPIRTELHVTLPASPLARRESLTVTFDAKHNLASSAERLRNLGHAKAYVLLFTIDSRNAVHWITPKYTRAEEDPNGMELARTVEERVLPTSVVFDDVAPGPLRIITIISPTLVRVSQVESLAQTELAQGSLAHRFARAEVREIVVRVSNAAQGKAP